MNDLISRRAVIDEAEEWIETYNSGRGGQRERDAIKHVISGIKTMPSVQPETAQRVVGKSRDGMALWYQCDMCNEPVDVQDNFCRGCGRRLIDE